MQKQFSFLEEQRIPIRNCRGQYNDNANNMSDRYQGTQGIIKTVYAEAVYILCMGHSLNLVCKCAEVHTAVALREIILALFFYSLLRHIVGVSLEIL